MELNLELNLTLTATSPVGGWVGGLKRNSCQSTQVEVVLEVGFELLKLMFIRYISSQLLVRVGGGWAGGRIKQK